MKLQFFELRQFSNTTKGGQTPQITEPEETKILQRPKSIEVLDWRIQDRERL
jgi:hypothetical protein